jgi:CheY-like chemotaxis protein
LPNISAEGRLERRVEVNTEPVWIDADPTRIEQIIGNLVRNAIKCTEPGAGIRVNVKAEGPDVLLEVQDDGFGIRPELLPHIFDLFVQDDETLDRAQGGLGIGLTLVRRLVELHGGSIRAASKGPGWGSTFSVRLARVAAPEHRAGDDSARGEPARRRVLLVEDNPDSRYMYRLALELAGHEVLETGDAAYGLELLKSERPDVALIDIGLEGLDGYELARRFRAEPGAGNVLLVALTGYGSSDDRERSRQAGFDHHLVKPVEPETLVELFHSKKKVA